MTVLNEMDRFHLVIDALNRLPHFGSKGTYLRQRLRDKLIEHRQYINKCISMDLPEVRNWEWNTPATHIVGTDP